jgi:lantibiotic modifying enzyme
MQAFQQTFATMATMPHAVGGICYAVALATPHLATQQLCQQLWQQLHHTHVLANESIQSADWPHGLASMVIGYLALHRVDPQRGWQQHAIVAGERLLQARQRNPQNERTWAGEILSNGGFGTSGIALALIRLYEYSRDYRFLRAGYEILHHQDSHYSTDHGGWPDIRAQPWSYPLSWCHGSIAPGMVRLALQTHERDGQPSASLLGLLDGIDSIGLHDNDGLCCGTTGSIDLLLSVGRELHQPYYGDRANYWLPQMIQRAHDRGGYVTAAEYPGIYQQPTLFQGTAGIAYQIARCAYPRLFPSLLLNALPRGGN